MTKRWILALIAGWAVHATAEDGDDSSAYLFSRAESFSYSEASPVTAYIDFLIGPAPKGGSTAFSRNNIELGIGQRGVEFSVVHRNDYNISFTPDTAEFAYRNKNRVPIPLDQEYDVDVWANQYQMYGAKFGFQLPLAKKFRLVLAYSHLWGTEAVSGHLGKGENGEGGIIKMVEREVAGKTRKIVDGTLYADYFYTDDPLFRREAKAPIGQGYAVDLGFKWQLTENLKVEGMVQDIAGEMRWDDMPYTIATATSDVIVIDDEGFLEANPQLQGLESFGRFTQQFTERRLLSARYKWDKVVLGYEYEGYEVAQFNRLVVGYRWSEKWGVDISNELDTAATGIRLWTPIGQLSFTTDNLDIDNAHTLGFAWNLHYAL